ncbi:hypothetical protein AB0L26_25985 [Streptomyces nondiastaticus]|uniref:hypothetical protein n=1 Tax=Streptomyces nondiastaticus TaxID=3154512 RepID=UPI003427372C
MDLVSAFAAPLSSKVACRMVGAPTGDRAFFEARLHLLFTTNTDQWPDNPRFTKLALTKLPAPKIPAMAVSDFRADNAEVSAGDTVTLKWNGPSTLDCTVSHGGNPYPVGKNHEYRAKIDRDTTCQLSYATGEPETTHYLTTTDTVTNPKLTGLEVDGPLTVTGDTGVQGLTVGGGPDGEWQRYGRRQ